MKLNVKDWILRGVSKCYFVGRAGHSTVSECSNTSVAAFLVLQQI